MKLKAGLLLLAATVSLSSAFVAVNAYKVSKPEPVFDIDTAIENGFAKQGAQLDQDDIDLIRDDVSLVVNDFCQTSQWTSKMGFSAVEIANKLDPEQYDSNASDRAEAALKLIVKSACGPRKYPPIVENPTRESRLAWNEYFNKTLALNSDSEFLNLLSRKNYSPVKISWEDISRYENSAWGDRISDVGIWVRKDEKDPNSAELALSVRKSDNFTDKVLVVPAEKIKVHQKVNGRTVEKTLAQRLKELGLASELRDKNVIVSNQFSIVPVPSWQMQNISKKGAPPRVAFNFSIYPYGSTNYVITDVIEGSSDAIVGPGNHQLLYANINGKKAPFTASRAEDRQDLLQLEKTLKAQGMDVDVQRYYLIQVPIKQNARGIALSNMGTPPNTYHSYPMAEASAEDYAGVAPGTLSGGASFNGQAAMTPKKASKSDFEDSDKYSKNERRKQDEGLTKVAIGHGETEGRYNTGSGFKGQRADEPVRVTVVYFVTPTGEVTQKDMETFSNAFKNWDSQAIWGGSFVVNNN